jgi:hypothetical protein
LRASSIKILRVGSYMLAAALARIKVERI